MQGIENKTELVGTILSRTPHPKLADYDILEVRVEDAKPVEGVADLLSSTIGSELAVTVRRALLDDSAQPGATIRSQAKRTPDGAMADTYPEAGVFEIRSAKARATERPRNPGSSAVEDSPAGGRSRASAPDNGVDLPPSEPVRSPTREPRDPDG